jgi:DNA polymerase elongation subunit (family B)
LIKGTKEDYEAAYVKEPTPGIYKWVVDIDVLSEYPTAIITLNMSPETYFGKITGLDESSIVEYTRAREFPEITVRKRDNSLVTYKDNRMVTFNRALKAGRFTVAPNGAIFTTDRVGCIADVEHQLFQQRKKFKKKMKNTRDETKVSQLDKLQYTTKILLNSIYGIMAIPYSRYANVNIAEAITACGRHIVKSGEKFVNQILNKPNKELKAILEELR